MAAKRTRCDWCKMWRVLRKIIVEMDTTAFDSPPLNAFSRRWQLCSQCRTSCEARLHAAFRDVPE